MTSQPYAHFENEINQMMLDQNILGDNAIFKAEHRKQAARLQLFNGVEDSHKQTKATFKSLAHAQLNQNDMASAQKDHEEKMRDLIADIQKQQDRYRAQQQQVLLKLKTQYEEDSPLVGETELIAEVIVHITIASDPSRQRPAIAFPVRSMAKAQDNVEQHAQKLQRLERLVETCKSSTVKEILHLQYNIEEYQTLVVGNEQRVAVGHTEVDKAIKEYEACSKDMAEASVRYMEAINLWRDEFEDVFQAILEINSENNKKPTEAALACTSNATNSNTTSFNPTSSNTTSSNTTSSNLTTSTPAENNEAKTGSKSGIKKAKDLANAARKATEAERSRLQPFIETAMSIRERKLEWTKSPSTQNEELIRKGDMASHYGLAVVDAMLYEETFPGRRTDPETYQLLYGVLPEVTLKLRDCAEFLDILNWRCAMKDFMSYQYTRGTYEDTKFHADFALVAEYVEHCETAAEMLEYLTGIEHGGEICGRLKIEYETALEKHTVFRRKNQKKHRTRRKSD